MDQEKLSYGTTEKVELLKKEEKEQAYLKEYEIWISMKQDNNIMTQSQVNQLGYIGTT